MAGGVRSTFSKHFYGVSTYMMARQLERPLLGAMVLAAASSVPMHVMPIVNALAIEEGRVSVEFVGWIGSACIAGELLVLTLLPALGFRSIGVPLALLASAALVGSLLATTMSEFTIVIAVWLCAGASCGVLKFLGNVSLAQTANPTLAVTSRLILVLLFAGSIAVLPTIDNVIAMPEVIETTAFCLAVIMTVANRVDH